MKHIAILDCAIKRPSLVCFNRLIQHIHTPLTYHKPSTEGLSSLAFDKEAAAYIIFGSASNVDERLDWHKELALFCMERLKENRPVLGICFGHQLMADAFGLEVIKNPKAESFYGTREITFTKSWGPYKRGDKKMVFVAHSYQVTGESDNLEVLATSEDCELDGLIHKELPYIGFQAHPEASEDFVLNEVLDHQGHNLGTSPKQSENYSRGLKEGLEIVKTFCESF